MRIFFKSLLFGLLVASILFAQKPEVKESKFKVSGNCGMCKDRIEKSIKIKEVKYAKWDKKSKMLTVAYLSPTISVDSLQKRIATSGHDTGIHLAQDSTYNKLPPCCLYRGNPTTH
ncbi:MAG: heavy-metal-associated domain-containing protein [Ignavibacteriales bacterium]|nr:heavy-metal-associated domain-containing protein [Ignavibacteriales bacterium]